LCFGFAESILLPAILNVKYKIILLKKSLATLTTNIKPALAGLILEKYIQQTIKIKEY